MKKIISLTIFLGSILTGYGQNETVSRQNIIKVNILSPILKTGSFFYERVLNESSSFQLGVGFTAYSLDGTSIKGIFITPEYRFYLSSKKSAPQGFYAAPYVRYQNYKIEDGNDKATLSTVGGGLLIGNQWLFKDRFSIDIFLGPNYSAGTVKLESGGEPDLPSGVNGFGARIGVTFGVAF